MIIKLTDPNLTKKQLAVVHQRHQPREVWESWIGKVVHKNAKKTTLPSKFKDGLRFSTVKDVVLHTILTELSGADVWAFSFKEHSTIVACYTCRVFDPYAAQTDVWIRSELWLLRAKKMRENQMSRK